MPIGMFRFLKAVVEENRIALSEAYKQSVQPIQFLQPAMVRKLLDISRMIVGVIEA